MKSVIATITTIITITATRPLDYFWVTLTTAECRLRCSVVVVIIVLLVAVVGVIVIVIWNKKKK